MPGYARDTDPYPQMQVAQPVPATVNGSQPVADGWMPPLSPGETDGHAPSHSTLDSPGPATAWSQAAEPPPLIPRSIGLREAISLALQESDVVRVLNGNVHASATRWDTLISAQEILRQQGRFNPQLSAGITTNRINGPPDSFFGPGLQTQTRRDEVDFSGSLKKLWASGLETKVGYAPPLAYLYFPNGISGFNPAYTADFVIQGTQPLLKGAGTTVNLTPIRVAQLQVDQTYWNVRESMIARIRSVEQAYWELSAAHIRLQAVRSVIPLARESVRVELLRFRAEQTTFADVARADVNLKQLEQDELASHLDVQTSELNFRQLLGLPPRDDVELIPVEIPIQSSPQLDLNSWTAAAMTSRPELVQQRIRLQVQQQELVPSKNQLQPELNLTGGVHINGLSDRLDKALNQAGTLDYGSWSAGLQFSYPLGNQAAKADVAARELEIVRSQVLLRNTERRVSFELAARIATCEKRWQQYVKMHDQLQQTQEWLRLTGIRYSAPPVGETQRDSLLLALQNYQSAMQAHVRALTNAGELLAEFNTALARLRESAGLSLDFWQVELATGDPQPALSAFTPNGGVSPNPVWPSGLPTSGVTVAPGYTLQP